MRKSRSAVTNDELINELIEGGYLKTTRLIEAFRAIDRKDFVPPEFAEHAYANEPLPIGRGQTISQPLTVAFMLELLAPKPGERVLDVGAGSGWQTALLAHVASADGEKGSVLAVERIPELLAMAEANIEKYSFIKRGVVEIVLGDASRGVPPGFVSSGGFDKIVAAAAAKEIPKAWKEQLKVGGRIVAPVLQSIVVLDKMSEKEFKRKEYFGFSFVPLVSDKE